MSKQVKGTEGRLVPTIDPKELYRLTGEDRIEYFMETLGVKDGVDEDALAYSDLLNNIGKACTGKQTLEVPSTIEGIHRTLSDAEHKACVVHTVGEFEGKYIDGLLMVVKETIYVQAVHQEVHGWKEVTDTQLAILDAASLHCKGSYSRLGKESKKLKLGLKEFKRAIVRLVTGTSTSRDILIVAVNMCEPVRYRYMANRVLSTIINIEKEIFDEGESCPLCDTCYVLIENWGKIGTAVDIYPKNKQWECLAENNKAEEDKILTEEFVVRNVRIVKKPGGSNSSPPDSPVKPSVRPCRKSKPSVRPCRKSRQ